MIKKIINWIIKWLWTKPTSKPEPLKATEVINYWTIVNYHGQKINLHNSELGMWDSMGRKDKRAMALRFKTMEKKGLIKFIEINGKMTCVKNFAYDKRAENKKLHEAKTDVQ